MQTPSSLLFWFRSPSYSCCCCFQLQSVAVVVTGLDHRRIALSISDLSRLISLLPLAANGLLLLRDGLFTTLFSPAAATDSEKKKEEGITPERKPRSHNTLPPIEPSVETKKSFYSLLLLLFTASLRDQLPLLGLACVSGHWVSGSPVNAVSPPAPIVADTSTLRWLYSLQMRWCLGGLAAFLLPSFFLCQ